MKNCNIIELEFLYLFSIFSKFAELVIYCINAYKNLHTKFCKNFSYDDVKLLTFIIGIASSFIFRYFLRLSKQRNVCILILINVYCSFFSSNKTFFLFLSFFFIIHKERNEYRNLGTSATRYN